MKIVHRIIKHPVYVHTHTHTHTHTRARARARETVSILQSFIST